VDEEESSVPSPKASVAKPAYVPPSDTHPTDQTVE